MANTTTRAMKRAASTLQDAPGLDFTISDPPIHYAMMYIDRDGNLRTSVSQSIQEQDTIVFNREARQNFLSASGEERVILKVGDTKSVMIYYRSTLDYFPQQNCSSIIKAVIKFIEPQKQAKHPYNGGKPLLGSATSDPEKTKPTWWPPGITHKHPEHMRKENRIELFLHILRELSDYGVTADKFEEIVTNTKLKDPKNVQIIYELLRVRKMEQRFERGEVDASTVIYVKKASSSAKGNKEDGSAKAVSAAIGAPKYKKQRSALARTTKDLASVSVDALPEISSIPLKFEDIDDPNYELPPEYANSFLEPMITDTPVSIENTFAGFPTDNGQTEALGYYGVRIDANSYQNIASPEDYGSRATSQSQPYHLGLIGYPNGLPRI
ncbi:hypothetical protein PENFLA_c001G07947 [Penicillium flavigenum]|uniref:Subtelomeric hrmA-associated cluster protein AFUB-079030/YDR124W-like helical bundle domain-containing protein n=1 Tax=Penicillium flavigenum TaxID=254877 RepID=A0A1V6U2V7_9EURO|nr:hypothetical protein PENFLA_c091G09469 [Penicillium flavigenum]OQE32898.1 hypothetical protein PENFLA_c001G07947 [Penicillium flavigenum]